MSTEPLGRLRATVLEPADTRVDRVVVLLHGFGAPGDDLVGLAEYIEAPGAAWVFPEAPIVLGGPYGNGRAWWRLDEGQPLGRDRSHEDPPELAELRPQLVELLAEVRQRWSLAGDRVILGGFSQGAMVACDVACGSDAPLGGLILMSGTLLARRRWQAGMAARAGLRALMSHGRYDALLPFASAEALRDLLVAAGVQVGWVEFDGGHEIPPPLLQSLADLVSDPT